MIQLTHETVIQLAVEPVDFRKQTDGLIALCENAFCCDPRCGTLFVFINRGRTMMRLLCYEENGYWLATKRLSRGRYRQWPTSADDLCVLTATHLRQLLKNVNPPEKRGQERINGAFR